MTLALDTMPEQGDAFTLTPEQVKSGQVDVDQAITETNAQIQGAEATMTLARWNLAMLAAHAERAGLVGKGKDGAVRDGARWATWREFGESFVGRSEGEVSKLRVIGTGVVEHDILPGTTAFTVLATDATNKRLRAAIEAAPTKTVKVDGEAVQVPKAGEVAKAIVRADKAAKQSQSRTARPNDGTDQQGEQDNGETPRPADPVEVAKALSAMVKDVDREVWAKVEGIVNDMVVRENTLRAKAAKAAAKS